MTPSEKAFKKNITLWAQANPQAAIYLPYTDCDHLQFCKTEQNELNLKREGGQEAFFYHSNVGAYEEALQSFSKLDLSRIEVLYLYGVGLGYFFDVIKPWLKKNRKRRLVFLEDDLAVIRRLFETDQGTKILRDKQTTLLYFTDLDAVKSPLSELYWQFMTLNFVAIPLPAYSQHKLDRFTQLQHKLAYDATYRFALVDEYLRYGVGFFRNFYANLLHMEGSYSGNALFKRFPQVPAIICGAGPSLNKQLKVVEKLGDRALIFAGGSALNALNAAGVMPHFGAGIDPNPEQKERLQQTTALEVPFFYRNRLYDEALKLVRGPKLYITGSGGYDIARWFEEKLAIPNDEEELDEGFNIVNFCISVAHALGCNPIVMIGMDLAYTQMEAYAKGVVKDSRVKEGEILSAEDLDAKAILREDIYGQPVYTLWKWVAEANWIGDFSKEHPDVQMINATEGGLGFPGVTNEKLKDVIKTHLNTQYNLFEQVQKEIQNAPLPQLTTKRVIECMHELKESLIRCQEHLQALIEENETVMERAEKDKTVPQSLQTGRGALSEIELSEEPGYLFVLEIFNAVYSKVLNHELQQSRQHRDSWRQTVSRLEINIKRLRFLKDVAVANLVLIDHTLDKEAV